MSATCACVALRPGTFIWSGGLPGRCPLVPRMAQKEHDRRPEPLKLEEAAELERALQSDDIAPVDQKTFGMRLAEIIMRVRSLRTPRQRK
jgi:hypothetical protein